MPDDLTEESARFMEEYDRGEHPLSPEDEAALERAKPRLMERITAMLSRDWMERITAMLSRDWIEIPGTGRWAPAAMAEQAAQTLTEIKTAIGAAIEWSVALPLIDDWATNQYDPHSPRRSPTYCEALVLFRDKARRGEWPDKDACQKCFGLACLACDFAGTRGGFEAMQQMDKEGNEAWDQMDAEHAEYLKRGICSRCGACNPDQAGTLCRPTSDESGEYYCPGSDLWEESRNA